MSRGLGAMGDSYGSQSFAAPLELTHSQITTVQSCCTALFQLSDDDHARDVALKLLWRIVERISRNPTERRYRSLLADAVHKHLSPVEGALEVLFLIGFHYDEKLNQYILDESADHRLGQLIVQHIQHVKLQTSMALDPPKQDPLSIRLRRDAEEKVAPGRVAIQDACDAVYTSKVTPFPQFTTALKFSVGGSDPLDYCNAYRSTDGKSWHYVTMGFSNLYRLAVVQNSKGNSGFGFELSFRLAMADESVAPSWPFVMLQKLARYVFSSGTAFSAGDKIDLEAPLLEGSDARMTALFFTHDPQLKPIQTKHGRVVFLQAVGCTPDEYAASNAWNTEGIVRLIQQVYPLLQTDLNRTSVLKEPGFMQRVAAGVASEGSSFGGQLCGESTDLHWITTASGDSKQHHLTLSLGAVAVESVALALKGRIPFDRKFSLAKTQADLSRTLRVEFLLAKASSTPGTAQSKHNTESKDETKAPVVSQEADHCWWQLQGDRVLTLHFTKAFVLKFCDDVAGVLCKSYKWEQLPNFELIITPTQLMGDVVGQMPDSED